MQNTKQKKSASQKRNGKINIVGRQREPYEVMLDNIHTLCPGCTYLDQVTDPEHAPLVSYPGDGQSSHVSRFSFSEIVYPDNNGRINATVSYNPFNLLDLQSGGTGSTESTLTTYYSPSPGQQWLFTTYPPAALPSSEAFGNTVPVGVIPICSMAGNGINVPGAGAPGYSALPCYQAVVHIPGSGTSLCDLWPTTNGAALQLKCGLVIETQQTSTTGYFMQVAFYDSDFNLLSYFSQPMQPTSVGSTRFYVPLVSIGGSVNSAYVGCSLTIPTPGVGLVNTLAIDPAVGAVNPVVMDIVQTNGINRQTFEAPGFTKTYLNGDINGYRVLGLSCLISCEASDLNNGGGIAGAIIPGGTRNAVNSPLSYAYLTTIDEWKKDGPAKNGMRGFLTYENKIQAEAWRTLASITSDPSLPVMSFALELGPPPAGSTAQAQTYRFKIDAIVEFKTTSQLIGRRKGRIAPMELDEAFALLRATPRFCDNPLHEKLVAGVKKAWETVQKYGPGVINLATKTLKYAPLVMAALA